MIRRFAILGASGDLTTRYLLPAVIDLQQAGELPKDFEILGLAREAWDDAAFRAHVDDRLACAGGDETRRKLLSMLFYHRADVTDRAALVQAFGPDRAPLLVYLALPPPVYAPTIAALAGAGLPGGSRLVIEKPFGEDLASARALNRLLADTFSEAQIFRIDHFLGMQTVQNILGLRFANRTFETLWNREHVARVEIAWDETLTLEGRADYYDATGALLDMLQNHLLQLLCLVAMEAPLRLSARDLGDRKRDVLRAVRRLSPDEVERHTRRARYSAGRIGARRVPAYREEPGVDPGRGTETFAELTLFIDNWRWKEVPFVLRTGKAMGRDRREIAVHFREVPHLAFEASIAAPNVLRLSLEPDRVAVSLNVPAGGERFLLDAVSLESPLPAPRLPAYARLLRDALRGDGTLAIRADEAEEAWEIVEPITSAWARGRARLHEYPAGSAGPPS